LTTERTFMPKAVGARELKTRLGAYLREVQRGVTLLITERGEPVAELKPLSRDKTGAVGRLDALAARGTLTRVKKAPLPRFKPIKHSGLSLSQAISEDREDRL
jgi:prevent-host-death family protein